MWTGDNRGRELFLMYFDVPEGWKSYLQGHLQPAWLAVSTDSLAPQVAGAGYFPWKGDVSQTIQGLIPHSTNQPFYCTSHLSSILLLSVFFTPKFLTQSQISLRHWLQSGRSSSRCTSSSASSRDAFSCWRFKGFSSSSSGWGRRSWRRGPCHGHARSGHARSGGSNAWGGCGSYDARSGILWRYLKRSGKTHGK